MGFVELYKRQWLLYVRNPGFSFIRNVLLVVYNLILGFLFFQKDFTASLNDTQFGIATIMMCSTIIAIQNYAPTIPFAIQNRAIFYREKASGTYSPKIYSAVLALVEIPWCMAQTLILVIIFFTTIGFPSNGLPKYDPGSLFLFWFIVLELALVFAFLGQLLAMLLPNAQLAQLVGSLITPLFMMMSGLQINPSQIPPFWRFLYWLSPVRYTLEALAITVFYCEGCPTTVSQEQMLVVGSCPATCPVIAQTEGSSNPPTTLSNTVMGLFEFDANNLGMDIRIL